MYFYWNCLYFINVRKNAVLKSMMLCILQMQALKFSCVYSSRMEYHSIYLFRLRLMMMLRSAVVTTNLRDT